MHLEESYFSIFGKCHVWSLYLRMLRGLRLKTTALLISQLLVKSLKNLQIIFLLINSTRAVAVDIS